MRFVIHLLLMVTIALGIGLGLSYYALTDGRLFGAAVVGPWTAWPDVGSAKPNPYTRSHLTRTAALQLGQSEGLQFTAATDSNGQPLSLNCTYRIAGRTPLATFWTLVAVDPDGVNLARPGQDAAMRSSAIARAPDGSIVIYVGKQLAPQNWLELSGDGRFLLVLTLYDTAVFSGFGTGGETMPTIRREACA